MKTFQEKLITISFFTIVVLGTVIMSLLFIFPTKDTREETMAAYGAVESGLSELVYDDQELARADHVSLDEGDMRLLAVRNAKSGANFSEEEVRRLKVLRTRFPENSLIPRVKTPGEERRERAEVEQLEAMKHRFSRKQGTREDIDVYYDRKLRTVNDWIQLLEHVVQEENWSPAVKKKYDAMLAHAPRLRDRIEKERTQVLELHGFE